MVQLKGSQALGKLKADTLPIHKVYHKVSLKQIFIKGHGTGASPSYLNGQKQL